MKFLTACRRGLYLASFALLTACGGDSADVIIQNGGSTDDDDDTPPVSTGFDATGLIDTIGDTVIVGTYRGMAEGTQDLVDAIVILTDGNLTQSNLQTAQQAWFTTRKYWESSEGFLWGPIDTEGFDPRLDDWPVNKVDLDNILADTSVDVSNQSVIDQLETTVKGFHTIEYLLFNDGTGNEDTAGCGAAAPGSSDCYGNVLAALADPRRAAYLRGIAINVNDVAHQTLDAWLASGGNFIAQVLDAGQGSATYPSQSALLEEVIQGMIGIADEVGSGKIGDPFSNNDPLTVESKFSGNSLTDFQYNMRSLRNLYCGVQSIGTESAENACIASGNDGLAALVSEENPELHQQMIDAIDAAVAAIADIPAPYYQAVEAAATDAGTAASIQDAIDAILTLMDLMSDELLGQLEDVEFAF